MFDTFDAYEFVVIKIKLSMVTNYLRNLYNKSYGAEAGQATRELSTADDDEDCYFCRISGFLVFGGTAVYCWDLARKARPKTADRRIYGGIGVLFGALAIFRA